MHKVERLVNLTVALLEARRPLTFAELRRGLRAYEQGDDESARRMFERDKDDLRKLGIPVETRSLDAFDIEQGYIVDRQLYAMPQLDLTEAEVAALAVALEMAGDRSTRVGMAKLAARAPDPTTPTAPVGTRIELGADAVDALADALVERQSVSFTYVRADGEQSQRRLDPYAVAQRRGHWYVVGRDHDRDAVRAFRLDRVQGRLKMTGEPGSFDAPETLDVAAHIEGPRGDALDALVELSPAVAWQAANRGGVQTDHEYTFSFSGVDRVRFLPWLIGLGPEARVLTPDSLRDQLTEHLRSVAEQVS